MPRVVVIGAGISGLVTALKLYERHIDVVVVDAAERAGGKILTTEIEGVRVDAGPDAFLVRQPYMADLCKHLNLYDDLVSPQPGAAKLFTRGALRPLPRKQYLGVPLDIDEAEASGILSAEGAARARQDLELPDNAPVGDETAGALIRRRLGDEVMDQLVGPLLGGINAGNADAISLHAGVPQLAAAAGFDASLLRSIPQYLQSLDRDPEAPIFLGHPNGTGQIIDALTTRLTNRLHLSTPVQAVRPSDTGWHVDAGTTTFEPDAVVLATPAFASARLVADHSPIAAESLSSIDYASIVFTSFAFPTDDMPAYEGSGFLVPHNEGTLMTACSWSSSKWAHLGGLPRTFLRVSAGRHGDDRASEMDDDELIATLLQELEWIAKVTATPTEVRVTRWPRAFPQYRPGHLDKVAGIEHHLAADMPGVFVTGAAYRGLGLPACVHQATVCAHNVAQWLDRPAPESAS